MKSIDIKGVGRSNTGKAATKKVRNEGLVPGTVYGIKEPANISVGYNEISKAIYTPQTYIVNLNVDGEVTPTVIREMQFHPVTDKILHLDFLRVDNENPVEIALPIKLTGASKGVLAGGKLVPLSRRIKVRGIAADLPDFVEVDVTELELGASVTVGTSGVEGLDITSPASMGIAVVEIPRAVKTAAEGGGAAAEAGAAEETDE